MKSQKSGIAGSNLGLIGIASCGLCCALPILGIASSAGSLVFTLAYAEKAGPFLLVFSTLIMGIHLYRKQEPQCSPECKRKNTNASDLTYK